MTCDTRLLPTTAFPFLTELSARLRDRTTAPPEVLDAVALLTATADPDRALRLRPRSGEPAALVERLAVWALHRVDAGTVLLAHEVLRCGADSRTPEPVCC